MPEDLPTPAPEDSDEGLEESLADGGRTPAQAPLIQITESALCDWIATAPAGESLVYHEGLLIVDRSNSFGALSKAERARVHAVARRAWIASELGLVHLFSKRLAEGRFRYIAVRARTTITEKEIRARMRLRAPGTETSH
jgi:hypothetical protein